MDTATDNIKGAKGPDGNAKQSVLKVHPADNVLVALRDLPKGSSITHNGENITLADTIPAKHKFFTTDMQAGDKVIMYGVLVGKAQNPIPKGGLMSTANVKHAAEPYAYRRFTFSMACTRCFKIHRQNVQWLSSVDGRVGTANYWLFIPTVFCENRNLDVIREAMHNELGYAVTDKYKQIHTTRLLNCIKTDKDISQT